MTEEIILNIWFWGGVILFIVNGIYQAVYTNNDTVELIGMVFVGLGMAILWPVITIAIVLAGPFLLLRWFLDR